MPVFLATADQQQILHPDEGHGIQPRPGGRGRVDRPLHRDRGAAADHHRLYPPRIERHGRQALHQELILIVERAQQLAIGRPRLPPGLVQVRL